MGEKNHGKNGYILEQVGWVYGTSILANFHNSSRKYSGQPYLVSKLTLQGLD